MGNQFDMKSTFDFSSLIYALSKLHFLQIIFLLLAALILFLGPAIVKRKYLKRVGLEIDERIEDRNSWILYPKQYNRTEKILMVVIFFGSFFLGVLALNIGNQ
jgi:hypothetical protein